MIYELILSDEAKAHLIEWKKSGQKKTLKKRDFKTGVQEKIKTGRTGERGEILGMENLKWKMSFATIGEGTFSILNSPFSIQKDSRL